jgi:hypothetical protein
MNEQELALLKLQLHQTVARRLALPDWEWMGTDELGPAIAAADATASNLLHESICALDAWFPAAKALQADPLSVDQGTFLELVDKRKSTRVALASYCNGLPAG